MDITSEQENATKSQRDTAPCLVEGLNVKRTTLNVVKAEEQLEFWHTDDGV